MMKPRRWYSSPEANPHPQPPSSGLFLNQMQLRYIGKVRIPSSGPVLKYRTGSHITAGMRWTMTQGTRSFQHNVFSVYSRVKERYFSLHISSIGENVRETYQKYRSAEGEQTG